MSHRKSSCKLITLMEHYQSSSWLLLLGKEVLCLMFIMASWKDILIESEEIDKFGTNIYHSTYAKKNQMDILNLEIFVLPVYHGPFPLPINLTLPTELEKMFFANKGNQSFNNSFTYLCTKNVNFLPIPQISLQIQYQNFLGGRLPASLLFLPMPFPYIHWH